MNILYVGSERSDAQAVATALRGIAASVTVTWTSRLEHATQRLAQIPEPELAALVVDARGDLSGWGPFRKQVRGLATHPPVIVILAEGAGFGAGSPGLDADELLTRSPSLFRDLPIVVGRAIERARAQYQPGPASNSADLQALVERERAARVDLEQKLTQATTALQEAEERHRSAVAAAAEQLARQQAQYDIGMARAEATWGMVDEQLRAAAVEVERSRRDQASAAADVERLSRRESELASLLADASATRLTLERQLADAASALEAANGRAADERRAAEVSADRQRDVETRIAQEIEKRNGIERALADAIASHGDLERRLAATEAAFQDATDRATRERLAAAKKAAEREAALDGQLRQERGARATVEQALANSQAALHDAQRRHEEALAASAQELADRRAQFDRELAEAAAARDSLAHRLVDAEAVLDQVQHDNQTAAAEVECLTRREAELASQLVEAQAAREAFEIRLAEAVNGIVEAHERAAHERAVAAQRQADFEARLAYALDARDALEQTLATTQSEALDLMRERDALQQSLSTTESQLRRLDGEHREGLDHFERDRAAADADRRRFAAERAEAERALEEARRDSRDALDRLSSEHATALAARDHEIEELQRQLTDAIHALEAAKRRAEELQAEADRASRLHAQLDESQAESDRLFQQAPLAMFRCTRSGALTHANNAWTALVRRKIDELRGPDFAAAVFESPGDLTWLIERCLRTGAKESIEATVRRKDGARLFVRLSACPSASNAIDIAAEDLTRLRVLQDRLTRAHRMEAVGRLAAEVALTSRRLLNDVHRNVQQWLVDAGGSAAARQQADLLLDELTRAAGQLQQLIAYGDRQMRTPAVVDLNTVVRDLTPVLRHVAGEDVEVQIPDNPSSVEVDVETERVERLLVSLVAYGRERMPFGGRLAIEVGTIVVDRRFTARHPNVRPGPHGVITVTGTRRAARADVGAPLRDGPAANGAPGTVARKPAVELRTLQGLVGECGGHLWMSVQPHGDMVAKVRLPLLTSYEQAGPQAPARAGGNTIARWFQH